MAQRYRLLLKPEPDGMGYIYGNISDESGRTHRVDIMPPLTHWQGAMKPTGESAPHPTQWVVYVDGEETARVERDHDIEGAILDRLAAPG